MSLASISATIPSETSRLRAVICSISSVFSDVSSRRMDSLSCSFVRVTCCSSACVVLLAYCACLMASSARLSAPSAKPFARASVSSSRWSSVRLNTSVRSCKKLTVRDSRSSADSSSVTCVSVSCCTFTVEPTPCSSSESAPISLATRESSSWFAFCAHASASCSDWFCCSADESRAPSSL